MAFDKFKQLGELNKMRQQAKQMQSQLREIEETFERNGIKVKVNGAQEIVYLEVDGQERGDILSAINEAMKQVQKTAAKKMLEMGGGLSGLFGN